MSFSLEILGYRNALHEVVHVHSSYRLELSNNDKDARPEMVDIFTIPKNVYFCDFTDMQL